MAYKIIDNTSQIQSNTKQKASIFLRSMAEEIVSISTPKTPKRSGRLRGNVLKQVLGLNGKIVWKQDYAVYQEEKQHRNYTTAGTGPHFAKDAVHKAASNTPAIARRVGLGV